MKRNVPVSKIMTTKPQTVHLAEAVSSARKKLTDGGFHHLPVVHGAEVVGMLSATDILRVTYDYGQDPRMNDAVLDDTHKINDLMTPSVNTIKATDPIRDAFAILADGAYHALPVVNDEGLVGIVTSTDLLKYALDQY